MRGRHANKQTNVHTSISTPVDIYGHENALRVKHGSLTNQFTADLTDCEQDEGQQYFTMVSTQSEGGAVMLVSFVTP